VSFISDQTPSALDDVGPGSASPSFQVGAGYIEWSSKPGFRISPPDGALLYALSVLQYNLLE